MLSKKRSFRQGRESVTDVVLLIDSSGSMQVRREETIREVNRYLRNLKGDGLRYFVTVKTFNTDVESLISHENIRDVGDLEHSEYHPSGWTALLDAVGSTLSNYYSRGRRTLFCVITDGEENSSRNYGLQQVKDMIEDRRSEDFQFVFLGDGPGAWQAGSRLGFGINVATDWTALESTQDVFRGLYTASNSFAKTGNVVASMLDTNTTKARSTNG